MRGLKHTDMKKNLIVIQMIVITLFVLPTKSLAWVGLELDSSFTDIADPYDMPGYGGDGGRWETSGRIMYQESFGPVDTEFHWLATALGSFGDIEPSSAGGESPFRILDLEDTHHRGKKTTLLSEVDRLSFTLNVSKNRIIIGRQAVSWGEAYYYNIEDLFGAFPVTETNRLHKPGMDALTTTFSLGPFSDLSIVFAPSKNTENSGAARLLFPAGKGSLSLVAGSILETKKGGAGYTVDVSGTKLYGAWLLSMPDHGDDYTEAVIGAERQLGPYTHLLGELYYNGWGTDDPGDYPALLLTERYLDGMALSLGKYNAAIELSRQITALLTLTPAVFTNLTDGSALLRMDGAYSLSDFTDLTAGVFLGLGERPDGLEIKSEYGSVPPTIYLELIHNL